MNDERVRELIAELDSLRQGLDPALAAVAVAIAIESSLGVMIAEDQLDPEHLGSTESVLAVISGMEEA